MPGFINLKIGSGLSGRLYEWDARLEEKLGMEPAEAIRRP